MFSCEFLVLQSRSSTSETLGRKCSAAVLLVSLEWTCSSRRRYYMIHTSAYSCRLQAISKVDEIVDEGKRLLKPTRDKSGGACCIFTSELNVGRGSGRVIALCPPPAVLPRIQRGQERDQIRCTGTPGVQNDGMNKTDTTRLSRRIGKETSLVSFVRPMCVNPRRKDFKTSPGVLS